MADSNETTSERFNCSALLLPRNAVCMEHPEEMVEPWAANPMFFEMVVVHVVTFVFGLCGNVIVVGVLTGDGKARTATNSFLVSLALGDLLMLCVYGPLETYTHFVIQWDENGIVCKMAKFAEFLSATSSVLNLLAVTVERFLVIVFPMKSRALCTHSNTLKAIAGVWLSSIALATPVLFTTGTFKVEFANGVTSIVLNYCSQSVDSPVFAIYQFIVIFFIPGAAMIVCYAFVIRELWASTREMDVLANGSGAGSKFQMPWRKIPGAEDIKKQNKAHNRYVMSNKDEVNAARKQVIKMLILVVFLFYLGWGPRLAMDLLQKLEMVPFTQGAYLLRIVFNMATFFHGCINPFVYSFMSRNFRSRLKRHFEACGCRKAGDLVTLTRKGRESSSSGERSGGPRSLSRKGSRSTRGTGKSKSPPCSFVSCSTKGTDVEAVLLGGNPGPELT